MKIKLCNITKECSFITMWFLNWSSVWMSISHILHQYRIKPICYLRNKFWTVSEFNFWHTTTTNMFSRCKQTAAKDINDIRKPKFHIIIQSYCILCSFCNAFTFLGLVGVSNNECKLLYSTATTELPNTPEFNDSSWPFHV